MITGKTSNRNFKLSPQSAALVSHNGYKRKTAIDQQRYRPDNAAYSSMKAMWT
jgi:hypothetical protein